MVGLNKTKDALSVAEDKYKALQVDMQRTQMDLLAKTSKQYAGRNSLPLSVCFGPAESWWLQQPVHVPLMPPCKPQDPVA